MSSSGLGVVGGSESLRGGAGCGIGTVVQSRMKRGKDDGKLVGFGLRDAWIRRSSR